LLIYPFLLIYLICSIYLHCFYRSTTSAADFA
jgi:hypothetical protein